MQRLRQTAIYLIILGFGAWGCTAHSAEPTTRDAASQPAASDQLALSTERLVVFKDGYGLVVQKGSATADADGRVFTRQVPDSAVLGCFWAVTEDKKIVGMKAEWEEEKSFRQRDTACLNVTELLRANVGKTVSLELTDKTEKGISLTEEGKIVEMLDMPAEAQGAPSPELAVSADAPGEVYTSLVRDGVTVGGAFVPDSMRAGDTLVREIVPRGGELVALERDGTRIVLPVSHVQSVSAKDLATHMSRQEQVLTKSKRLSFDFGKDSAGKKVDLHLYFFTPGLRWIPTYRVSGELVDKADVALQGELINDVVDVHGAALDLVVGVPNFRFKSTVSPLTLEAAAVAVLQPAFGNNNMQTQMNAQFDNGDFRRGEQSPAAAGGAMDLAPELAGSGGEQDLFVYSLKEITLKKGGRATMPLWQQTVPLRHVYTYDIQAHRDSAAGSLRREAMASPTKIEMNQVWHQLELTNAGKVPWTTGAALMLRGNLPLGQDLITYTHPDGKALLPVTIAVDIRGTFDEQESDRKPNALHVDGVDYAQITKKGTITLTSYRTEKSDVRVTLSTGGKVTNASDNADVKLNDFRAEDWDNNSFLSVNNHSDAAWDFTIEPGKSKTLTFDVTFYAR